MKENTKTWLLAVGTAALIAFAALAYYLYPGIIGRLGIDREEMGGLALAALVLWLALRKHPLTKRARLMLGIAVATGLLLGAAVFFIS